MISTDVFNALTNELGRLKAERQRVVEKLDAEIATLHRTLELLAPGRKDGSGPPPPQPVAPSAPAAAPAPKGTRRRRRPNFTQQEKARIRQLRKAGSSFTEIAKEFGAHQTSIARIVRGRDR